MTPDAEAIARMLPSLPARDVRVLRRIVEGLVLTREPAQESEAPAEASVDPAEVSRRVEAALGRV